MDTDLPAATDDCLDDFSFAAIARIAYEAVRDLDPHSIEQPSLSDYPGGLGGDACFLAQLEYDFRLMEARWQAATRALAAAGFDPDDCDAAIAEALESGSAVREAAEHEQADRNYRTVVYGMGLQDSYDPQLGLSRGAEDRRAWNEVYGRARPPRRPLDCASPARSFEFLPARPRARRHRSGHRAVSNRSSGEDPPPGEGEDRLPDWPGARFVAALRRGPTGVRDRRVADRIAREVF
jgi:hypothetical protein